MIAMVGHRISHSFPPALLAAAALLSSVAAVQAGSPSLQRLAPRGAQRGTTATIDFHGARLAGPQAVLFYRPGATVQSFEEVNDNHVRCTMTIAPDCPTGLLPLRLVTVSGITELKLFSIGNCPEISEAEPNGDAKQPQTITLPVTINGTITSEDIDYFAFTAAKDQRLNFEIEAMRLGDTVFDPHLALFDERGAVLASADDTRLVAQDAVISYVFSADGTYCVAVREASYLGNDSSFYRLHIGEFPRPQGVFPSGGAPGANMELRWLGDPALGTETITLPTAGKPVGGPLTEFALHAHSGAGTSPSAVPFRLSTLQQTLEVEPNDELVSATPSTVPGAMTGILSKAGDVDRFKFSARKGQKFAVRLFGRALRSPIDSVMGVHKLDGANIVGNDDSGGPDSAFTLSIPQDGEYVLYVHDLLHRGGELYTYRVEVTPVAPSLTLSTPAGQQHVAVPQGNRNAVLIRARRQNFGGPLTVQLTDLPAGLALHAVQMQPNVSALPIVLEASEDAPLRGMLADVVARHADPNRKIEGRLRQSLRLTEFKDQTMCGQTVTRLPVAVTRAVPFSVQIVEPQVPLVQRGHMDLVVQVTRTEGLVQPRQRVKNIHVRMLWNPPGVGSGTADIPGDKTSATLRLNANGGAALGDWPMVVVATADVGGTVQVSSLPTMLTIAQPHVDLTPERARVTQGQQSELLLHVNKRHDLPAPATVEVRGLPRGVSAPTVTLQNDAAVLHIPLTASADAALGRHGGVHVLTTIASDKGTVRFVSTHGLLIVDAPLPQKKDAPASAAPPPPPNPQDGRKRRVRIPRRPGMKPLGGTR